MNTKKDNAPRDHKIDGEFQKKGLILVLTGDGKGKSTSSFGTAIRAMGRGMKVAMVQFIKGTWETGEDHFFRTQCDQFELHVMGEGFTWDTKNFEKDCQAAQKAWEKCKEILFDERFDLVIFDEINYTINYNFLGVKDVIAALKEKPSLKHVILTGNHAPKELIGFADLVTEMKCIKHPYNAGIPAQPGIEY